MQQSDFVKSDNYSVIPIDGLSIRDWLGERCKGIGGSDLAGIMGMSNWATPLDVYLDKTGQADIDDTETPHMRWGHLLEPLVADEYQRMYPDCELVVAPGMLASKEYPFMLANLDRIIITNDDYGVFEIKTVGFPGDEWGHDGGDEVDIPERVLCQVLHYLAVTGFKFAVVAAFFMASRELRRYFIQRDETVIQNIIKIESRFWNHNVIGQNPPDPSNIDDCNKRWQYDMGTTIEATTEIHELCMELHALKANVKDLQGSDGKGGRRGELETMLRSFMGDNQVLISPSGKKLGTWKSGTTNRFSKDLFIEAKGQTEYDKYKKSTPNRTLRMAKTI